MSARLGDEYGTEREKYPKHGPGDECGHDEDRHGILQSLRPAASGLLLRERLLDGGLPVHPLNAKGIGLWAGRGGRGFLGRCGLLRHDRIVPSILMRWEVLTFLVQLVYNAVSLPVRATRVGAKWSIISSKRPRLALLRCFGAAVAKLVDARGLEPLSTERVVRVRSPSAAPFKTSVAWMRRPIATIHAQCVGGVRPRWVAVSKRGNPFFGYP